MPFQKGNTLWKEGVATKLKREDKIREFFLIAGNGGIQRYGDMLDRLARGEEIRKPEREFCDRFEKLFQYFKAKKTDITTDGEKIESVLVQFLDANNTNTKGI